MTARSKSDSKSDSLEILGWQQKARRGFEQYLKSINLAARISSRWSSAAQAEMLFLLKETGTTSGRGPRWELWSSVCPWLCGMLQAAGEVNYSVVPPLYGVFLQKCIAVVLEEEAATTLLIPPLPALIQSHQDPLHGALSMRIIMTRRLSGRTRTCAAVRYDNQAPASPL